MTRPAPERDKVLDSCADALRAFDDLWSRSLDWNALTPCARWSVLDLSGHLLAITRYWRRLLDAAESTQQLTELPRGNELAAMNAPRSS